MMWLFHQHFSVSIFNSNKIVWNKSDRVDKKNPHTLSSNDTKSIEMLAQLKTKMMKKNQQQQQHDNDEEYELKTDCV